MSRQNGNLAGHEFAGYRLLHVLGSGGASEVYLAQRLDDPTALVAFKVLMPSWQLSPTEQKTFYARFQREAQAAQRLQHPHVLPVLAYGEEGGTTYMVLPFMSGGTLATRMANFPHGLPLDEASLAVLQVAEALDFAHSQGIVHRDIKPSNVLIDGQGQLMLADFGIARLFDPGSSDAAGGQVSTKLTVTGQVLGTPIYMAPEQLVSARVGPSADIYALGILLYELVTGEVPFRAATPVGLAIQHVQESPPAPSTRRPDLPEPAEAAISKALSKSPEDRFASAGALARAFAAGLRDEWTEGLTPTAMAANSFNTASTMVATALPPPIASPTSYPSDAPTFASAGVPPRPAPRHSGVRGAILAGIAVLVVVAAVLGAQAAGFHIGIGSNPTQTPGGTTSLNSIATSTPPPTSAATATATATVPSTTSAVPLGIWCPAKEGQMPLISACEIYPSQPQLTTPPQGESILAGTQVGPQIGSGGSASATESMIGPLWAADVICASNDNTNSGEVQILMVAHTSGEDYYSWGDDSCGPPSAPDYGDEFFREATNSITLSIQPVTGNLLSWTAQLIQL